jgi:hypothetical protein
MAKTYRSEVAARDRAVLTPIRYGTAPIRAPATPQREGLTVKIMKLSGLMRGRGSG